MQPIAKQPTPKKQPNPLTRFFHKDSANSGRPSPKAVDSLPSLQKFYRSTQFLEDREAARESAMTAAYHDNVDYFDLRSNEPVDLLKRTR